MPAVEVVQLAQVPAEAGSVEDVVAEDECGGGPVEELLAEQEGLGKALRRSWIT